MSRFTIGLLMLIWCSFVQAGTWDVQKFYNLKASPQEGKYQYEQVFMVYFQGIFDGLRFSEHVEIQRKIYCFPDNKLPSSQKLFELVSDELERTNPLAPEEKFFKTSLVIILTHVLAETYRCKKSNNKASNIT